MHTKIMALFSLLLASSLGFNAVNAATTRANRDLCSPQSADMSSGSFTTTCDWSRQQPGTDADAIVTLNGQQNVHAECEFTGPDIIGLVYGNKHAEMKTLVTPGNRFTFDIKYKEMSDAMDDNQNIQFYLNTKHPDPEDRLVCQFTTQF